MKKRTYKTNPNKKRGKYRTYKRSSEIIPIWKPILSGVIAVGLIIGAILFFVYKS